MTDEHILEILANVVPEGGRQVVQGNVLDALDEELLSVDELMVHEGSSAQSQFLVYFVQNLDTYMSPEHETVLPALWAPSLPAEVLEEALQYKIQDFLVSFCLGFCVIPSSLSSNVEAAFILLLYE